MFCFTGSSSISLPWKGTEGNAEAYATPPAKLNGPGKQEGGALHVIALLFLDHHREKKRKKKLAVWGEGGEG